MQLAKTPNYHVVCPSPLFIALTIRQRYTDVVLVKKRDELLQITEGDRGIYTYIV